MDDKQMMTAQALKNELWATLKEFRAAKIKPAMANAIATQAREILRTVKTELDISQARSEKPLRGLLK